MPFLLPLNVFRICTAFVALLVTQHSWAAETETFSTEQLEFFEAKVRPLLVAHCFECHSTDAAELKAGLYVDSREGLLKGGDSGPAVVLGKPAESLLISAVSYQSLEMPPASKLSRSEIDALTDWVQMGAPWPQVTSSPGLPRRGQQVDWPRVRASHWAWQQVHRPALPAPNSSIHPIDQFVRARRSAAKLTAAAPASPHILARRIYVDLVGILPTPQRVAQFTAACGNNREDAVLSLIDELLSSPLYGQRWGRHWLDVARYSDGHGGFLDNRGLDQAWRYRDWVVQALNQDMPIDQFLRLQISGDLTGKRSDAVATGFFALGPTYRSDGGDPDSVAQAKGETLDDRVDTLTRGLLGITVSCARCHDHKFDPIPQRDYYSLAGVFHNTAAADLPLAPDDVVAAFQAHQLSVTSLEKQLRTLRQEIKRQKREATAQEQQQMDDWSTQLSQLKATAPAPLDTVHALTESGSEDMHVAIRGNLRKTGELAPRQFLRVLSPAQPQRFSRGSGREELAQAIVAPTNPLTARVFVNRVWMHHFDAALVRTPGNFGVLGEKPTHPQLLDWLASEFMTENWSLKSLHRLIMTSATYQLSSVFDPDAFNQDPDNRRLWRMNPRRMDVEAWRDSLLALTGDLDTRFGGPPVANIIESARRTLYAKVSRNGDQFSSDMFLRRFDFPLMRATVVQRPRSIVPQQFLFLLNSEFMVARARALVARLRREAESDRTRIEKAYELLYHRLPHQVETRIGLDFLDSAPAASDLSSWSRYAQVLLSSNEFMYVR